MGKNNKTPGSVLYLIALAVMVACIAFFIFASKEQEKQYQERVRQQTAVEAADNRKAQADTKEKSAVEAQERTKETRAAKANRQQEKSREGIKEPTEPETEEETETETESSEEPAEQETEEETTEEETTEEETEQETEAQAYTDTRLDSYAYESTETEIIIQPLILHSPSDASQSETGGE